MFKTLSTNINEVTCTILKLNELYNEVQRYLNSKLKIYKNRIKNIAIMLLTMRK